MTAERYPPTLPAAWYRDPEIFERERRAIFARNWALVARVEQLAEPGQFVAETVAGYPVLVLRDEEGGLRGFHNVCRHRASPILQGEGRCDVLRCPYHGWTYDLDGALRKAPGFEAGADFDPAGFGLLPVRVAQWNGLVFACLDEAAPDLEAWLGDILAIARDYPPLAEMAFVEEETVEGAADWKTYSDNSAEGYHLPHIHKALNRAVDPHKTAIAPHENGHFVGFDVTYRDAHGASTGHGHWIYKFPGLLLHFSRESFNLERVLPLGPGRLRLVRWFWFPHAAAADTEACRSALASSTAVMREDLAICEAVQRNLEAGVYRAGVISAEREPGTAFFQRLVREALDGEDTAPWST